MATTTTTTKPKQLGQLLQEQQEPFVLEIFLSERGYQRNNSNSRNSLKGISQCSKVLKAVYNKLFSITSKVNVTENARNNRQEVVVESDRFSSASCTTVFNSCAESDDVDDEAAAAAATSFELCNPEAVADRKLQCRCLQELASSVDETKTSTITQEEKNRSKRVKIITDESILSASFWNLHFHSNPESESKTTSTQFFKSKRVLLQTKQLLFDCVREVLETHERERKQQNDTELLGSELLGELVCEKMKGWGKHGFNITQLLDSDFQDSIQEWNHFEPHVRDIALEIGDSILEDIKDQICTDMVFLSNV